VTTWHNGVAMVFGGQALIRIKNVVIFNSPPLAEQGGKAQSPKAETVDTFTRGNFREIYTPSPYLANHVNYYAIMR